MNNEQSKEFEKKLLEKRRGVTANPSRTGLATDPSPEYGRDEGDRANASQAKEMTWLRTSQERGLLELVEAALSRIRDGTLANAFIVAGTSVQNA